MSSRFILTLTVLSVLAAPALAGGSDVQVIVKFKGDVDSKLVTEQGGKILTTLAARGAVVAKVILPPCCKIAAARKKNSVKVRSIIDPLRD